MRVLDIRDLEATLDVEDEGALEATQWDREQEEDQAETPKLAVGVVAQEREGAERVRTRHSGLDTVRWQCTPGKGDCEEGEGAGHGEEHAVAELLGDEGPQEVTGTAQGLGVRV
jgi:hypothetical protein